MTLLPIKSKFCGSFFSPFGSIVIAGFLRDVEKPGRQNPFFRNLAAGVIVSFLRRVDVAQDDGVDSAGAVDILDYGKPGVFGRVGVGIND